MKLRTKKSQVQVLPEGSPPNRILPGIMKILYFLILISILGGVVYVMGVRLLYFRGNGQVEVEKRFLSSKKGGNVSILYKGPDDTFKKGETLAIIAPEENCRESKPDTSLIRLLHEIKRMEADLQVYQDRLNTLMSMKKHSVLQRALEIGRTDSYLREEEARQKEKDRLKEKISLLKSEILIRKNEMAALKNTLNQTTGFGCGNETIRAPFNGLVSHITRNQDEFIPKGEPLIMIIPEDADVSIHAYFDWKTLRYIELGETMTITFPQKVKTKGKVAGFFSAASRQSEINKKDYVPVASKLSVRLVPENKEAEELWKKYDRMDVRVAGGKR